MDVFQSALCDARVGYKNHSIDHNHHLKKEKKAE
jgi:hypothetical protein